MSTSFGKDPHNPRHGGDGEGGKWPEVIGGGDHDSKDGSSWFGGDSGYITGDDQYDAGGEGLDHEWYINGGEGGYISGKDLYDAADEYSGRTSEDISGGDDIGEMDPTDTIKTRIDGDFYIVDPTWVSGHINSFSDTTGL